ncbi:MAG: DUF134 domain-containing protein [Candidatus Omnitrophica bacterium]|nr:DUF134 domain-containing protein [Candidatus Omnitrophota bacterium]
MTLRGRPKKRRLVDNDPRIAQFSPRGRPGRPDEAELGVDEFEALRLADYQGKKQKEAARSMRVSQQTFSRIVKKAHKTLADAMVNGKRIRIQGGSYLVNSKEIFPPKSNNPRQRSTQIQP